MTQLLPPKKEVALALLERSNVDVYLDPRAKGVVVPPQFKKEPRLILKIGLNMPVPIPDLRLDDESMSCTLSFNRQKFFCVVPWLSVFAMVGDDGRGMVWPDDVPQELAGRSEGQRPPLEAAPAPPPSSRGRGGKKTAALSAADDPAPSERGSAGGARAGKGKKTKKKDEAPARPMLVAVPKAPPSGHEVREKSGPRLEKVAPLPASAASKPDVARESRPDDSQREGAGAEPSSPMPPRVAARTKRELPPYLRVVK